MLERIERSRAIRYGWLKAIILFLAWAAVVPAAVLSAIALLPERAFDNYPLWFLGGTIAFGALALAVMEGLWRWGTGVSTARWLAGYWEKNARGNWLWVSWSPAGPIQYQLEKKGGVPPFKGLAFLIPLGGWFCRAPGFFQRENRNAGEVFRTWRLECVGLGRDVFLRLSDMAGSAVILPAGCALLVMEECLRLQGPPQAGSLSTVLEHLFSERELHRQEMRVLAERVAWAFCVLEGIVMGMGIQPQALRGVSPREVLRQVVMAAMCLLPPDDPRMRVYEAQWGELLFASGPQPSPPPRAAHRPAGMPPPEAMDSARAPTQEPEPPGERTLTPTPPPFPPASK